MLTSVPVRGDLTGREEYRGNKIILQTNIFHLDREIGHRRVSVVWPRSWRTRWSVWGGQMSSEKALDFAWKALRRRLPGVGALPNRQNHGGGEHLPLDDRDVDCDLIEPTGVHWRLDQHDTGVNLRQALYRCCPARRRALVDDPEPPCPARYGSSARTGLPSRPQGASPVVGSQRPIPSPRRTAHAARDCQAPPRSYAGAI